MVKINNLCALHEGSTEQAEEAFCEASVPKATGKRSENHHPLFWGLQSRK